MIKNIKKLVYIWKQYEHRLCKCSTNCALCFLQTMWDIPKLEKGISTELQISGQVIFSPTKKDYDTKLNLEGGDEEVVMTISQRNFSLRTLQQNIHVRIYKLDFELNCRI